MKFFDTHAHIGLINEDPIEQLIIAQEAKQENVDHIVSICTIFFKSTKIFLRRHMYIIASAFPLLKFPIQVKIGC